MRVLYIYCHPLEGSFHAAILKGSLSGLAEAGHVVDLCDLYAEGFDPVLSAEMRRRYHDTSRNRIGVEEYIERLYKAEALIVQFPVWSFGPPAMLKGFFDRLLMPGVAFDMSDPANITSKLRHIRALTGITTYGRPWWTALYVGDPPKKMVKRYLPRLFAPRARVRYHALYHMNVATEPQRKAFISNIRKAMRDL